MSYDVDKINQIPIRDVAQHLGMEVPNGNQNVRCFNSAAHSSGDRTGSMKFYDKTNTYHCFGCNIDVEKGSDVIGLIRAIKDCDFKEACNWASTTFGIGEVARNSIKGKSQSVTKIINRPEETLKPARIDKECSYNDLPYTDVYTRFYQCCSEPDEALKKWWTNRGLSLSLLESVGLRVIGDDILERLKVEFPDTDELFKANILVKDRTGSTWFFWKWKPTHRIVFPFFNGGITSLAKDQRKVLFFRVRSLTQPDPKYFCPRYPEGMTTPIFGADELYEWLCASSANTELYITESETDRFAMKEYIQMAEAKPNTLRFVITLCSANQPKNSSAPSDLALVAKLKPETQFRIVMDDDKPDNKGRIPSREFAKSIFAVLTSAGVPKENIHAFRPHWKYGLKDIGDYVQALKANTLPEQIDKTKGTI